MFTQEQFKSPESAALIAAAITAGYIYAKSRLNNEAVPETHEMAKPAVLNAILVYFIVSNGIGCKEPILTDEF